MGTLSRREEETLAKTTKEQALKECDPVVKGMSGATSVVLYVLTEHLQPSLSVLLAVLFLWLGHVVINIRRCRNACLFSEFCPPYLANCKLS